MKWVRIFFVLVCLFTTFTFPTTATTPKNVIFMVMDGASSAVVTLARLYKEKPLALDEILVGGVRTNSLNSVITDSAAAATAMSTGHKTFSGMVGMMPTILNQRTDGAKPVATLLEAARLFGYKTGIVTTSPVQHATPAGFSAHVLDRKNFHDIAEQQVYQGFDVVLGGGKQYLTPGPDEHHRQDNINLVEEIKKKGYYWADTKDALEQANGPKIWGAFADDDIAYEFDRNMLNPDSPTLAEMTKKAIDVLSKQANGFFLLVEGSKVDWAAHKNDPIGMISEVLGFDEAVRVALDFAKRQGNTMVIAVTDHGNSGLSIGNARTDKSYMDTPVSNIIPVLQRAKLTATGATSLLKEDRSNLEEVAELYGIDQLSEKEKKTLLQGEDIEHALGRILAERADLGFTTYGHTGEDVFLYAYGPEKPTGFMENTDLSKIVADFLNIDLTHATEKLFMNARQWYESQGYTVTIDESDPFELTFVAKKEDEEIRYPENKNYKLVNGEKIPLIGINVFNGTDFFVPKEP